MSSFPSTEFPRYAGKTTWSVIGGLWPIGIQSRIFFSSRRRHTRCLSDWTDVCSSDLVIALFPLTAPVQQEQIQKHAKDDSSGAVSDSIHQDGFMDTEPLGHKLPTTAGASGAEIRNRFARL